MKLNFKIHFPSGYQINDLSNDNIDIHVITDDKKVYFATLFTLSNIKYLMIKDDDVYFWVDSMLIVSDLKINTIEDAIARVLIDGYIENALSFIGNIEKVYGIGKTYEGI